MLRLITVLSLLSLPKESESIDLNIEGQIHLGPKWLFEYDFLREYSTNEAVSTSSQTSDNAVEESKATRGIAMETVAKKRERKRKTTRRVYTLQKNVPNYAMGIDPKSRNNRNKKKKHKRYYVAHNKRNIFIKPLRVSDDDRINNFTDHIYQHTLKLFRTIKRRINNTDVDLKKEFDILIKNYKEKFKEFANENRKLKIETRIGTQKVFLNTIETSNRILGRLVNYLAEYLENESKRDTSIANDLDEVVNKQIRSEYDYVCTEYGICRSCDGYLEFLSQFLTEALKNDDKKLKMVVNSFIEASKKEDNTHVANDSTYRKYKESIMMLENFDIHTTRAGMTILKNMIEARNKPLEVDKGLSRDVVNKSVTVMDLLDTLDKKMPPTKANKLVWEDILTGMKEFREGKREDIKDTMKTFSAHMKDSIKTAQGRVGLAHQGFRTIVQ